MPKNRATEVSVSPRLTRYGIGAGAAVVGAIVVAVGVLPAGEDFARSLRACPQATNRISPDAATTRDHPHCLPHSRIARAGFMVALLGPSSPRPSTTIDAERMPH